MSERVQRVITHDLPADVEGYYWRRGWVAGAACTALLWLLSANDGGRVLWVLLFGDG